MLHSGDLPVATHSTNHKMDFLDKVFPQINTAFMETHHKNEEDFPSLIKEYIIKHYCIHAPTPTEHTQNIKTNIKFRFA